LADQQAWRFPQMPLSTMSPNITELDSATPRKRTISDFLKHQGAINNENSRPKESNGNKTPINSKFHAISNFA